SRREAEVEGARQDRFRKLVLRCAVAAAAGVDDVEHDLRVDPGLDAHHQSFRGKAERSRSEQIVAKLGDLGEASLLADKEHFAKILEERLCDLERRARAR